jgi:hypothetical protein
MKRFMLFAALVVSLASSGCTPILKEVRYPGGYPGHVMDKRTFDASANKRLQLLRGAMVLAIAARIGEASVRAEDGDGFARLLGNATAELNHAAANLGMGSGRMCTVGTSSVVPGAIVPLAPPYIPPAPALAAPAVAPAMPVVPPSPDPSTATPPVAPDSGCEGYYVNFEADVARIEARVTRAMVAALPTDRAREFLNKLGTGDLLSSAWSALGAGADIAGAFHRGAGVYRSGLEIVAVGMEGCAAKEETMTVLDAADCLELDREHLFDAEDATADKFLKEISPNAFHAIMRIVRTSCVALPLSNELEIDALNKSRATRRESCSKLVFEPTRREDQVPS